MVWMVVGGRGPGNRLWQRGALRARSAARLLSSMANDASHQRRKQRASLDRPLLFGGLAQEAMERQLGSSAPSREAVCLHSQRPHPRHRRDAETSSPSSRPLCVGPRSAEPHFARASGLDICCPIGATVPYIELRRGRGRENEECVGGSEVHEPPRAFSPLCRVREQRDEAHKSAQLSTIRRARRHGLLHRRNGVRLASGSCRRQ